MSRLKRFKEKRKNQFIKTAMSSLALTLVIGSSQTMTTYAWFTDTENVNNDLVITMGKLNVLIGNGFDVSELNPVTDISKVFKITNNGTLNQHLRLSIEDIDKRVLKYTENIEYSISFKPYKGKEIKSINGKLDKISSEPILTVDGKPIVLSPQTDIEATANLVIQKGIPTDLINSFADNPLKFQLKILANQVNTEEEIQNIGFSDIAVQNNSLQFEKAVEPGIPEVPNMETTATINANGNILKLNIKELNKIPITVSDIKGVEYIGGIGTFAPGLIQASYNNNFLQLQTGDTIVVNNDSFKDADYIDLKFKFDDNGSSYINIRFRFRDINKNANNNDIQVYYEILEHIKPEEVEQPKEEIEEPSDPEVGPPETPHPGVKPTPPSEPDVEGSPGVVHPETRPTVPGNPGEIQPPNEEIEKPSEPEVVEPPKEEIIEIPKQPEAIEPPKENEGIQE